MEKTYCGISLGETMITDIDFTDDVVIFAETLEVLVHALDTLGNSMPSQRGHRYPTTNCCEWRTCLLGGLLYVPWEGY